MCHSRARAWLGSDGRSVGAIFAGHRIEDDPMPGTFAPTRALAVAPAFLERLLWHLRDRGIAVVSLREAMHRLQVPGRHGPFACFTFDDGYADNCRTALPIFASFGAPFAVFLTTGFIDGSVIPWWDALESAIGRTERFEFERAGRRRAWPTRSVGEKSAAYGAAARWFLAAGPVAREAALADLGQRYGYPSGGTMLNWDMVRAMARTGLVEFGCHTVSHPRLSGLSADAARNELAASRSAVETAIGRPVDFLAYPYGDPASAGPRERALAAAVGFTAAVTTRKNVLSAGGADDLQDLPRIPLNGHFQRIEYVDLLLSGAPFTIGAAVRRLAGRRRRSARNVGQRATEGVGQ